MNQAYRSRRSKRPSNEPPNRPKRVWLAFIAGLALMVGGGGRVAVGQSRDSISLSKNARALLSTRDIELSQSGLDDFFSTHANTTEQARKLIPQLGSRRFAERDQATQALAGLPTIPRDLFNDTIKATADAEVRMRLERILKITEHKPDHATFPRKSVCRAILQGLVVKGEKGDPVKAATHIRRIAERYPDIETLVWASRALEFAAVPPSRINEWMQSEADGKATPTTLQLIAVPLAAQAEPQKWFAEMKSWSRSLEEQGKPKMAFLARLHRLNLSDRSVLAELVECLDEAQPASIRNLALQSLRIACDQPKRAVEKKAWNEFLENPTDQALKVPVDIVFTSFENFLERVRVCSSNFDKGNSCAIEWDRELLIGDGGQLGDRRGINVFAIHDDEPMILGSYDVFLNEAEANAFAKDILALPEGSFVAIVACDEPSRYWNAAAQKAIESIGAKASRQGTLKGKYRHAYYCLGEKGAKKGTAREAIDPAGGPLTFPKSYAKEVKLVDQGAEDFRKDPRYRIIRGEKKRVN